MNASELRALQTPLILLLIIVALLFDFMNGFHDADNSIATIVSTGAITLGGTTNLNGFGLTLTTGAGDITLSNCS